MQKAESQRNHVQKQPAQRQGSKAALESPRGDRIAQLEAMVESGQQADKLAQLAAMVDSSPAMAVQCKVISAIHNSPNLTMQRQQFGSLAGETAQSAEAPAKHSSPIQLSGREGDEGDPGPGQGESVPPTPRPLQGGQIPPPLPEAESLIQDGYSPRAGEERDETAQLVATDDSSQLKVTQCADAPVKPNNTGMPDNLKNGIESLSGMAMDNVKVHYNSSQPAQLNALAYAQGTDIHVAPGQERHLPHEAWHVVQQAQGRVKPTMQMKDGLPVNDDAGLEREADAMGAQALQRVGDGGVQLQGNPFFSSPTIQRVPLAANANLGWDAAGAETWAENASNPAPIGPNLNTLVASGVLTAANAAAGFVSGHVIAAAMGGVNTVDNIVGWDAAAHETPQTAFEVAVYHGGAAAHGFGALAPPEANETGTVNVNGDIGGTAAVTTIKDAWVVSLRNHVVANLNTLKQAGHLVRNPAIPAHVQVADPTAAQMDTSFGISLGGGHAVEYVARVPSAYRIRYAPTNAGHSNAPTRTSELTQVSLPAVALNAGATPQQLFDAMRGGNPTIRIGQWILSGV